MTHDRITAAAIVFQGVTVALPPPARHHTIQRMLAELYHDAPRPIGRPMDQGFVTQVGRFVGRSEARRIAIAAGQCLRPSHEEHLFSEDLW